LAAVPGTRPPSEPLPACLDGEVVVGDRALIPASDDGLLRGDGVFEVVRAYRGHPFCLDEHVARLRRSGEIVRLGVNADAVRDDVVRLLDACPGFDGAIRVVLTRGGRRIVLLEALPIQPSAVALASVTYAPTRVLDGAKTLSYGANVLATRLAQERGYDDALLTTPHGRVLEAPTSSFFWASGGVLRTPPLDERILASITRSVLLGLLDIREEPCPPAALASADEAFVASSLREVLPVRAIDDRSLEAPGPLTRAAQTALRDRIADATGSGAVS